MFTVPYGKLPGDESSDAGRKDTSGFRIPFEVREDWESRGKAVLVMINSPVLIPPPTLSSSRDGAGDTLYPKVLNKSSL